jgi:uncharacterized protein YhaN
MSGKDGHMRYLVSMDESQFLNYLNSILPSAEYERIELMLDQKNEQIAILENSLKEETERADDTERDLECARDDVEAKQRQIAALALDNLGLMRQLGR